MVVTQLRVDIPSVIRELDVALKVLAEAKIVSRYRRIFKGKGLEFEDFREYTTSDDANEIDWKASARANKTLIREFREERDMDVYFLVDVSSSMLYGSTPKLKYEYAAELTTAFMHFVLQSGDKTGLVLFTDKVVKYIEPAKGMKHFYMTLQNLLNPEFYGGNCNLKNSLEFLMNIVERKSLAFLITDFIGLGKGWEKTVKLSSGKLDGVAINVVDPVEMQLPDGAGQVVISDPFSEKEMIADCNDDKLRDKYQEMMKFRQENLEKTMGKSLWEYLTVDTSKSFVRPVVEFLRRREILSR